MSGALWMFSDKLDDADMEMFHRTFITYQQGADYYGMGLRQFTGMAHEAGAVYKVGRMVRIRRDRFEAYLRQRQQKAEAEAAKREKEKREQEAKRMRQGVLVEDPETGRMDVRFGMEEYYGGLHCGMTMDVLVNGTWVPTRIEMGQGWYLVGIRTDRLSSLSVRL